MYISIQNKKHVILGEPENFLLLHVKILKIHSLGRSPRYILFFDKFFDPNPFASWGTIYTNPILQ